MTWDTDRSSLTRFAWLSIGAAVVTIALKTGAYLLTGSVGLLSDALESSVNLVGALMGLAMLTIAARPADEVHAYGHDKAEYFSSGVTGALILAAAVSIGVAAVQRLLSPRPLEQLGVGLLISAVAALVNLAVALVLLRAGRRHRSVTLESDARHLLTDVWTSVGVVVGVGAVAITGWVKLDPIVAIAVALNIVWAGVRIVRTSVRGLMDTALPPDSQDIIQRILDAYKQDGVEYHALRTRRSGARQFVSLHVMVPGAWTVARGHRLVERIESDLCRDLQNAAVLTHLESIDDPASWDDGAPDRSA